MRLVSALLALAMALGVTSAAAESASAAEPPVTRLALVMPMTVPPQSTGLIPAESLAAYTAPTGRLTRELDAIAGQPVAIGLDPMIIASIRILGSSAPASATQWLQRLAGVNNEMFPLSYADSDIAALSQAGSGGVLAPTSFPIDPSLFPDEQDTGVTPTPTPGQTAPPAPELPTAETITQWPYTLDGILWPRQNTVTAADLAGFNAAGPVTTILSSGNVTATTGTSAAVGDHRVLVSDEIVSTLLSEALGAPTTDLWQAAIDGIAAELAARPGSRTVLAAFDRSPGVSSRLGATISAVSQLTGVQPATLAATQTEPQAAVRIADIPANADRVSRIRLMLAAEARIIPFSSLLADPTLITGERRLSMLALSSNSWAATATVWTSAVDAWLEQSNQMLTSVKVAESSTLNFLQDTGNLPIAVSNNLDHPVRVYVSVRSSTGILVVTNSRVPLDIPASSQARAAIPVQSIANGEATLEVSLSSETNVPIGSPQTVTANVVAGWETTATFVIAGLLMLLFVAGIVRTVVKRRRAREGESLPEQDE
jgi:hypothetical protein